MKAIRPSMLLLHERRAVVHQAQHVAAARRLGRRSAAARTPGKLPWAGGHPQERMGPRGGWAPWAHGLLPGWGGQEQGAGTFMQGAGTLGGHPRPAPQVARGERRAGVEEHAGRAARQLAAPPPPPHPHAPPPHPSRPPRWCCSRPAPAAPRSSGRWQAPVAGAPGRRPWQAPAAGAPSTPQHAQQRGQRAPVRFRPPAWCRRGCAPAVA
jgi:hypothetical protein